MTVDITIGKRERCLPLFPCDKACPAKYGDECCWQQTRQEERAEAPPMQTATAQGIKTGGFNFTVVPIGYWFRFIEETGLVREYPWLNIPSNDSMTFTIPDGMGLRLHQLSVQIALGQVVTAAPQSDEEFACWMAWWCIEAPKRYGLLAVIETH